MPEKLYYNLQEKKLTRLLSDNFECQNCLCVDFDYEVDTQHLAGDKTRGRWNRVCTACGLRINLPKKMTEAEKKNFILYDDYKKTIDEAEQTALEAGDTSNNAVRRCIICNKVLPKNMKKTCSNKCRGVNMVRVRQARVKAKKSESPKG